MTSPGIEPATFRLIAQHLNHYTTACLHLTTNVSIKWHEVIYEIKFEFQ
jgi:hypothetical protein